MEHSWSSGGNSSETGNIFLSTHSPSSFTPDTDTGGSSSSPYACYPPYKYGPPTSSFAPYHNTSRFAPYDSSSSYTIDYSGFASYTHSAYAVIAVHVGSLFPSLLSILYILNF